MDSGVAHEQLNTFLSAINLPIIHHKTIKRAEAVIGPAFEAAAKASCERAVQEEKKATELKKYYLFMILFSKLFSLLTVDF